MLADVPARTGLGSSSSLRGGATPLDVRLQKQKISPEKLAELACQTEIEHLKEPIGKQDQYASRVWWFQFHTFLPSGKVIVEPLKINRMYWKNSRITSSSSTPE